MIAAIFSSFLRSELYSLLVSSIGKWSLITVVDLRLLLIIRRVTAQWETAAAWFFKSVSWKLIVLQNVELQNAEFQNIELQNAELQNAGLQNIESYRTSNLTERRNTKCRILQNLEIQNVDNTKRQKVQDWMVNKIWNYLFLSTLRLNKLYCTWILMTLWTSATHP